MSATVTVKLCAALLPALSVAVHVTVVVPSGNVAPDAGVQFGVTAPSTASVAVTVYDITVPAGPTADAVNGPGTLITGGVVSCTVTVKLVRAVLPLASVAVHVTVVVPVGKVDPEEGWQLTGTGLPPASVALGPG